jgi:hypothetical protein
VDRLLLGLLGRICPTRPHTRRHSIFSISADYPVVIFGLPRAVQERGCSSCGGDSQESFNLRSCLRELGLPVVHIDGPIPDALRKILEKDAFPRLNLQNVLSAISRTGAQIPDVFQYLSDDLRTAFADWARANVSQISKDQIPLAQGLPIWWSAGGGTQLALRPSSEVHLLPEKLTLQDAAIFMADCVAEDASLTHLHKRHMTFNELPHRLRLPDVLDMPTLLLYKQFYNSWITHLPSSNLLSGSQPLLTCPNQCMHIPVPQDLFKRGPLFTAVFPEDSPVFVHAEFQEYEEVLCNFGLKTEEGLDVAMFMHVRRVWPMTWTIQIRCLVRGKSFELTMISYPVALVLRSMIHGVSWMTYILSLVAWTPCGNCLTRRRYVRIGNSDGSDTITCYLIASRICETGI